MIFCRRFSRSTRALDYARTVLNPAKYTLSTPGNERSCIILATEAALPGTIEAVSVFHQANPAVQLCVAGVNSVLGLWNGVSEYWLDEPFKINSKEYINNKKPPLRESDGITPVRASENWKLHKSSLQMNIENNSNIDGGSVNVNLNLANTVFCTGLDSTLIVVDNAQVIEGLKNLDISVSTGRSPKAINLQDRWIPLYEESQVPLKITKCIGNLAKEINKQAASGYLQDNEKLMSLKSKETQVYVKLTKKSTGITEKYEVIAGGGGWGAKASTLVIAPPAKLSVGDEIQFFMVTPEDRYRPIDVYSGENTGEGPIGVFDCSGEPNSYENPKQGEETVISNVFGGGSENGFQLNGINYVSVGERAEIEL